MDNAKPENSPVSEYGGSKDDKTLSSEVPFREAIGSLMYASVATRIDIAYAVGKAARAVAEPTEKDWHSVKRVFKYLAGQVSLGISYSRRNNKGLVAYCDSDFAGDEKTSKSTTGSIIMFGGGPIHWRSNRQKMVTTSSTEAEYVSLCTTVKDVVWIRKLAQELNFIDKTPTVVYCDNQLAIRLAHDEKSCQRTKHMKIQADYPREQIEGKIEIQHKRTDEQIADMLTKSTTIKKYVENRDKVMVNKTLALAMIMSLSLVSQVCCYKFDTVSPIIYQQTDRFVDLGVAQYTVDFTYTNPCDLIIKMFGQNSIRAPNRTMSKVEQLQVQSFSTDCFETYHKSFIAKMNEVVERGRTKYHLKEDDYENLPTPHPTMKKKARYNYWTCFRLLHFESNKLDL